MGIVISRVEDDAGVDVVGNATEIVALALQWYKQPVLLRPRLQLEQTRRRYRIDQTPRKRLGRARRGVSRQGL